MSINLDKHLPTQKNCNEGIWVEIFPKIKFLLGYASVQNKRFKTATLDLKLRDKITASGNISNQDEDVEAMFKLYSETIVLGWKGLKDDGVDVPFSKEKCVQLFKEYPELFLKISNEANRAQNFIDKNVENIKKKS